MELPTGTVTFLFTDIEGSTRLWENHRETMAAALVRHDSLAAEIIAAHNGVLVKSRGEGDSLFVVFARAPDALVAACALQRAFVTEPWPEETPIRVRMALHTGEADMRSGDYYGPDVNRCARLRAIANGEQIILSRITAELGEEALGGPITLRDCGEHQLRDLSRPERVFQLLHPGLPADFSPLRSLSNHPNNLLRHLTSFVGREKELREVRERLAKTALLTLTGAGGCGKTRLALQVAADVMETYPDGVWLIELASLSDPALVPQTIANALRMREEAGRPILQTLSDYLKTRTTLLVLDNCEHLLAACAKTAEFLLRTCPNLRILATSQAGLNLLGEHTYPVPTLALPSPHHPSSVESVSRYESVRLFTERAIFSQPNFELTDRNAPAVVQVCQCLDGIPLAIELAAARVRALSVEQIASRLDDRFRLLTGGSRTALPRHQTLRGLIDWSYQLLNPQEQALLRRLSVFAGGWTLEAAEAVCADATIEDWEVLDLQSALVEKSLVMFDQERQESRYRLLETVRQYALERLIEAEDSDTLRARHLDYYGRLADKVTANSVRSIGRYSSYEPLEPEQDNVRAALEWSREQPQAAEPALRLAGGMFGYWYMHGNLTEAHAWIAEALSRDDGTPTFVRAKALMGSGYLSYFGNERTQAHAQLEESIAILRTLDDRLYLSIALNLLGNLTLYEGDFARTKALAEEGLSLAREQGNVMFEAFAVFLLGFMAYLGANHDHAAALLEESTSLWRRTGNKHLISNSLVRLGDTKQRQRRFEEAQTHYIEALQLAREQLLLITTARCLQGLAGICAAQQQFVTAAHLLSARHTLVDTMHMSMPLFETAIYEQYVATIRTALGEETFATAWGEGQAMTLEEAIDYTLARCPV